MDAAMRKRKRNERFSRPGWFEKVGEKYEAEQEWIALFSEKVVQDTIAQTVELKENAKLRQERDEYAWNKFTTVYIWVVVFLLMIVVGIVVIGFCEYKIPHQKLPDLNALTQSAKHKRELSDDENDKISTKHRISNLRRRITSGFKKYEDEDNSTNSHTQSNAKDFMTNQTEIELMGVRDTAIIRSERKCEELILQNFQST